MSRVSLHLILAVISSVLELGLDTPFLDELVKKRLDEIRHSDKGTEEKLLSLLELAKEVYNLLPSDDRELVEDPSDISPTDVRRVISKFGEEIVANSVKSLIVSLLEEE